MKPLRRKPIKNSVKEALDNLPSGLCFFSEKGLLTLCNYQMHRLAFALMGKDLQNISELKEALMQPSKERGISKDGDYILLADDTAWHFTESTIEDDLGNSYTEFIAADVTKLYQKTKELSAKNKELAEMAAHMERINKNVTAIMREEKTLSMKMRLHNELGSCVLSTRKYFLEDRPKEQKPELILRFEKTLTFLKNGIKDDDFADGYQELLETAAAVGAKIILTGELPQDPQAADLIISAMRESLTNAIRHGRGDKLYVKIIDETDAVTAMIKNNGKPPRGKITEGGGLGSLRSRIEKAGGTMTIESRPEFILNVRVLKGGITHDKSLDCR